MYVQAFMIVKKVLIEDSKEPLSHIYYYIMYRLLKPDLKLLTRNLVLNSFRFEIVTFMAMLLGLYVIG